MDSSPIIISMKTAAVTILITFVLGLLAARGVFYRKREASKILWDGIFIGATATRQMFYSMLVASGSFFLVYYSLHEWMGNHALWLAFIVYLSLRGIMQAALSRKILYQS